MKEKQDQGKQQAGSISNATLAKFVLKLIRNQPKKLLTLTTKWTMGSADLGPLLGQEVVNVLNDLKPNLYAIVNVLITSNPATNIDELYESIKPKFDALLNQKLGAYGVSLKEAGIEEILTESYIKQELLPIFLVVRDIPKFCKSIKEKNILKTINDSRAQLITHLETDLHSEMRKHLVVGTDGLYEIGPTDPALVSQIKKVLNALVYAEKVVNFINSMDLNPDSGFKLEALLEKKGDKSIEFMTKIIWHLAIKDSVVGNSLSYELNLEPEELGFINEMEQAIQYARKAQSSLLEVDLPVFQMFNKELGMIAGVIDTLDEFASGETKTKLKHLFSDSEQVAKTAGDYVGKPMGLFVDHLKPHSGKTDYSFLTRHLGLLPGYLDQLTKLISTYGAAKPTELALSDAEKEVFKDAAIKLFFEISNYDNLPFVQKGSALLFPIRKSVVTLGQGAYNQVTRVNEATGEMVAHQLSRVKTELLTKLIAESDKMELYLGLIPGVLTKPLMMQLNELYKTLVFYANNVIDLKEKYPDLLHLDNTSFLAEQLQNTLQQKNMCQSRVDDAKRAKHNLNEFFDDASKHLSEKRIALKSLYQSFKHYVIEYNPRLSVLMDRFFNAEKPPVKADFTPEELQLMFQEVRKLCDKDIVTYSSYVTLADDRLAQLPKQIKGKLFPLNPKNKHSFLVINERDWLVKNKGLQPDDKTSVKGEFIDDLASISTENRAELYNYHSIRVLMLEHIHKEIDEFLKLLADKKWLSNKKKTHIMIERYRVLQPFIVDLMGGKTDGDIDKAFVELLNQLANNEQPKKVVVTLDGIKAGMDALIERATIESNRSKNRRALFAIPNQQIKAESTLLFDKAPLTLDSELVKRQDKWIPHQRLSRASNEMKIVLFKLLHQFDSSLNLVADNNSFDGMVPFPEMENDLEALRVPTQVSWAKRMINIVHYINSNFTYLESLDKDVHKKGVTQYFLKGPLVEGIYQIKPFLELTKAYQTLMELIQEPTGQIFLNSLQNDYTELMAAWDSLKPLYFLDSKEVQVANPAPVKSSGMWYPFVSLMVLPEHLTALAKDKKYTPLEAEKAQQKAKESAQYIEDITEKFQAGQYFNLLWKSPYILFKFLPELKEKLDRLREDTNSVTTTHLSDIQSALQGIVLEADALELRYGLQAGLISKPTRLIVNKLFSSFIEPLGISLQESTQLVLDTSHFKQRLLVNQKVRTETLDMLKSEQVLFGQLDSFLKKLEELKIKIDAKQELTLAEREEFKEHYWTIYPLLQSQQSRYALSMDQRDKSIELDELCDECFKAKIADEKKLGHVYHYNSLKDVMYLVKHVHAAKQGNINSLEMKNEYLLSQAKSISKEKQLFAKKESREALEVCITNTIDRQIALICKKSNQPIYLIDEFKDKLLEFLLVKKEEILQKVSSIPIKKLDKTILTELEKQHALFNKTDSMHFGHLDAILTQVVGFQAYCQKETVNPVYENKETLAAKTELLSKIKKLAEDKSLPLEQRISEIKKEAKAESFYTILMSHDNRFKFDAKTLKRVFLNLFHSIFNFFGAAYRPSDFYTSLDKVIKNEQAPKDKSILSKTGFFSTDAPGAPADESSDLQDQPNKPGIS